MEAISKKTLSFLKDLKANNNRDWFTANRSRYEEAKEEFEKFIDALIQKIAKFDKSIAHVEAKKCVFRIYRDVRFSKDKSPYKTHFGAHITAAVKKSEVHSRAGYYIHIGAGDSMLAGGAYLPQGSWLNGIRKEIEHNSKEFRKIISSKEFKKYFGEIEGDKLVKAPKGFSPDHEAIEFLKLKSFLAVHKLKDSEITGDKLLDHAASVYKVYYPFCNFLNDALEQLSADPANYLYILLFTQVLQENKKFLN